MKNKRIFFNTVHGFVDFVDLPSEENYQVCLHTYIGSEVAQSQGNSGLAEKVS